LNIAQRMHGVKDLKGRNSKFVGFGLVQV